MSTLDERIVRAPLPAIFALAADVTTWPAHLWHYRFVTFSDYRSDGGGIVDMAAFRPFGPLHWPVWWRSEMQVNHETPEVRFRHIGGVTTGMDVSWTFTPTPDGTRVRILHVWNGLPIPVIGRFAAVSIIGPIFIHGVASRTLEGLARAAEREALRSGR